MYPTMSSPGTGVQQLAKAIAILPAPLQYTGQPSYLAFLLLARLSAKLTGLLIFKNSIKALAVGFLPKTATYKESRSGT